MTQKYRPPGTEPPEFTTAAKNLFNHTPVFFRKRKLPKQTFGIHPVQGEEI